MKGHHGLTAILAAIGVGIVWFIASPLDDVIYLALIAHYAGKKPPA